MANSKNPKSVKYTEMGVELSAIIKGYGEAVVAQANKVLQKNAKAICNEIPNETAFKDTPDIPGSQNLHLRTSFYVSKKKDEDGEVVYLVHARGKKAYIGHLVENGHSNYWNPARRVPPHHFLMPLVEKYRPIVEEDLKKVIQEAGSEASSNK